MNKKKIACFGEVLWDIFPEGEKIGGAPLNVALRLHNLGMDAIMISKVGSDANGDAILDYFKTQNLTSEYLYQDSNYKTGEVLVKLDTSGSASYTITHPVAWDQIQWTEQMEELVTQVDAFVYGSLVCRDEVSRETLLRLLTKASYKVFDINLRKGNYNEEYLFDLLKYADFIKFNDDELFEIAAMYGSPYNSLEQNIIFLSKQTNTEVICVTKGRHGAVLLDHSKFYYNSGYQISVQDTVGAGDSFLASLLSKLLMNEQQQEALDFACAVGALVAGKNGANPLLDMNEIMQFKEGKVAMKE